MVDFVDIERVNPVAVSVIITTTEQVENEKKHVNRNQDDYREQQQQQHAKAVVALNLGLHANVSHSFFLLLSSSTFSKIRTVFLALSQ
jgi:hypothetical protein